MLPNMKNHYGNLKEILGILCVTNGLKGHMSRKHSTLVQFDGSADNEKTNKKYSNTEHYWMNGWLGISYHVF